MKVELQKKPDQVWSTLYHRFCEIYCQESYCRSQQQGAGIMKTNNRDFDIPVVVMFNLKEEQKAYVFSTINGNQVKVERSLIYDLFDLSESRGPYKTCHQIARIMKLAAIKA